MIQDIRVKGVLVVLALVGALAIGSTAWTAYKDYQDFKAMRLWVAQMQAQQRAVQQRQAPRAEPPVPAFTPAPVEK